ncbi:MULTISPECIES: SDR family NAD(P)-dependent oxidoreductase [unclassified Streptomyces]|uniref:SDR family NAD(P)-dependent oxidoreductase n=1 Tax=unclassified Streptomyces TaxID=2593676 RepID=UPI001909705C|nr:MULTISPECIES: SDR family NAD(P)-dependent oxidoreductase [unclassified Streptomyces]MBK3565413.1 SDR family NAD(P)-dependent oxidoreductase [Streptomyces sp. MBT62]MBK6010752.1 SDR family NAD(P)-dependent oxidoreductase [Streptomyces sp. MBT53]
MGNGALNGAVIAVAGAGGPAGHAVLLRLAEAGATVVGSDAHPERLAEAVDAARYAHGGATVVGDTVDLLDPQATRDWAAHIEKDFGRVDGLVHLVGGWRGSATFTETDLADWDLLEKLLIRTVQHTSLAFYDGLERSDRGRYLLISAAGASKPTAGNAAYSASKAAAEAWTLAMADGYRKAGGADGPTSAAAIMVVKALVHDAMRAERPNAKFAGFTDVKDLAEAIAGVWDKPAAEVNGNRLWLTEKP